MGKQKIETQEIKEKEMNSEEQDVTFGEGILDLSDTQEDQRVPLNTQAFNEPVYERPKTPVTRFSEMENDLVNCLSNEKVIVRFIAKRRGSITDPTHVLYGGMSPNSHRRFGCPKLRSGQFVDVLTNDEKRYLEYVLNMAPNSLSIYNKNNNFWDDSNPDGIGRVDLHKGDNVFDMSDPLDYIRVKMLKARKDVIASSLQELQDRPKATYQFVIVSESDDAKNTNLKVTAKAQAYMEFGKINDDKDILRAVIEIMEGRPLSANSKIEALQAKVGELIESNTKMFLSTVRDPLLKNKVLIKKAIDAGVIANRGNYLYLRDGNMPLCENGQEPTLNIAAQYLASPKHQEIKFTIEAKLKL